MAPHLDHDSDAHIKPAADTLPPLYSSPELADLLEALLDGDAGADPSGDDQPGPVTFRRLPS